jgi:hypothetical protein
VKLAFKGSWNLNLFGEGVAAETKKAILILFLHRHVDWFFKVSSARFTEQLRKRNIVDVKIIANVPLAPPHSKLNLIADADLIVIR